MRKRWYFPKKKENSFSSRRWTNQICWRRSGTENIHLDTGTPNSRRKSKGFSCRIRRVSSSTTSRLISGCPWSDEWFLVHVRKLHIPPSRWTPSQTLLAERRIIPNSTEVHWHFQNYTYEFGCEAWETHRWLLEYRWVSRLVRSLERVHTIYSIGKKKPPDGQMWSGVKLTENNLHPGQIIYGQSSGSQWERMPSWRRSKSGPMKKLHLENARKLRGIYFIDPQVKEFKETIKNARKKSETSVAPALPCKIMKKNCGSGGSNKIKTKLACILEADEFTRLRIGNSIPNYHEDHIAAKGDNSLQHYKLVHKIFLCLKLWKFLQQKQRWTRNGRNLKRFRRGTWQKSETNRRWSMKQGRRAQKFTSPHWWTSVIWRMLNWRQSTKCTKVELYSWAILWKMILGLMQYFTEQGSLASQMTAAKVMDMISRLPGCEGQAADAVSAYTQGRMEDAPKLLKIPKSECPDIWSRLPRHKWPISWSSMEDPVVLLEPNLYGHPLAGLLWEKQFEKIILKYVWEKVSIKLAGKKQNINSMWKVLNKEVYLGEPTSFLDHVYLGCTQRQGEMSKDIVDNYRTMFESWISAGSREITMLGKSSYFSWSYDMEGHAKKRVEDIVSRQTRRLNNSAKYQLHALMTITSKKKNWNPWETCQKCALKLFLNTYTWHVLLDPIFHGRWTNLHDRSQNGPKLLTNE